MFSHDWFSRCWWISNFHPSVHVAMLPTPVIRMTVLVSFLRADGVQCIVHWNITTGSVPSACWPDVLQWPTDVDRQTDKTEVARFTFPITFLFFLSFVEIFHQKPVLSFIRWTSLANKYCGKKLLHIHTCIYKKIFFHFTLGFPYLPFLQ